MNARLQRLNQVVGQSINKPQTQEWGHFKVLITVSGIKHATPTIPSVTPQLLPTNCHRIDNNELLHYSSATISFNNVAPIRIACIVLLRLWWSETYSYTYAFNLSPLASPNSQRMDIHQGMRQPWQTCFMWNHRKLLRPFDIKDSQFQATITG